MALGYREITKLVGNTLLNFNEQENLQFCELGNNYLKGSKLMEWLKSNDINLPIGGEQHSHGIVSKLFWEYIGFVHTSIDMNGYDGSLNIDLRKPVPSEFLNKFNIVYDGGTGEHVDNQYSLFKNCHDIVMEGGTIIHILPKTGHFPNHCSYYYTIETFEKLNELNGYKTKELFEHDAEGGTMIYSVIEKITNDPFINEDTFSNVPITYTQHIANDKMHYPYAYK